MVPYHSVPVHRMLSAHGCAPCWEHANEHLNQPRSPSLDQAAAHPEAPALIQAQHALRFLMETGMAVGGSVTHPPHQHKRQRSEEVNTTAAVRGQAASDASKPAVPGALSRLFPRPGALLSLHAGLLSLCDSMPLVNSCASVPAIIRAKGRKLVMFGCHLEALHLRGQASSLHPNPLRACCVGLQERSNIQSLEEQIQSNPAAMCHCRCAQSCRAG